MHLKNSRRPYAYMWVVKKNHRYRVSQSNSDCQYFFFFFLIQSLRGKRHEGNALTVVDRGLE